MRSLFTYAVRTAPSNAAVNYSSICMRANAGWNATQTLRTQLIPDTGVLKRWQLNVSAAPGAGKSWTFEIMLNGVASGYSITIADSATFGRNDNELAITAGDIISVRSTPSGSPTAAGVRHQSVFESSVIGNIPFPCGINTTLGTTSGLFSSLLGGEVWATSAGGTSQQLLCPASGTIRNMYVNSDSSPGASNTMTFTARKNGTNQSLVTTISGASTTGNDLSNSFTVAAGDLVDIRYDVTVGGAWGANKTVNWGVVFQPDNQTQQPVLSGGNLLATATENYMQIQTPAIVPNATELNVANFLTNNSRLRNLYAQLDTAPGSGSWDVELNKNGSATALAINTVTSTALQSNLTDVIEYAETETASLNCSPNTPGAATVVAWGINWDVYVPGVQSRCMMGCGI